LNQDKKVTIGAFICLDGGSLNELIDVKQLRTYLMNLPGVKYVESLQNICSKEGLDKILSAYKKDLFNSAMVLGCTPRTHSEIILSVLEPNGLNRYRYEHINIREQCAWVHKDKGRATEKAKDLARMGASKLHFNEQAQVIEVDVVKASLVIGGGVAGMQAAVELAKRGHEVHLIEKTNKLGGRAAQLHMTFPTSSCGICCMHNCFDCRLTPNVPELQSSPQVKIHLGSEVEHIDGGPGNYKARIQTASEGEFEIEVGTIIIAIGTKTFDPTPVEEYGYGRLKDVITSIEIEKMNRGTRTPGGKGLHRPSTGEVPKLVNFIQCVGSRGDKGTNPHCSIVCCNYAIGQALAIKEKYPETRVVIHNTNLQAPYRGFEEYLREAEKVGVEFVRGEVLKIEKSDSQLKLIVDTERNEGNEEFLSDLTILSVGQEPSEGIKEMAEILDVPLDWDNLCKDLNIIYQWNSQTGIFLAGCVKGPMGIRYSVADGIVAATFASEFMERSKVQINPLIAEYDEDKCTGCGTCTVVCPYGAVEMDKEAGKAKQHLRLCKGCGVCAASCPERAISMRSFSDEQIIAQVHGLLEGVIG